MASPVIALNNEYKDFDPKLKTHPEYGDILPIRDVQAIKNSIKNILNTRPGERPFNQYFGCGLYDLLFEPNDAITKKLIKDTIKASIEEYEPRYKIIELKVEDSGENGYRVFMNGVIVNSQREVDISLLLKRFS